MVLADSAMRRAKSVRTDIRVPVGNPDVYSLCRDVGVMEFKSDAIGNWGRGCNSLDTFCYSILNTIQLSGLVTSH